MRTFVIGDIHGCHQILMALLAKINPISGQDTLVFLGDYIDRGPESRQVVETVISLVSRFKRVITLMGNHEEMFNNYLEGVGRDIYLQTGGRQTIASYGGEAAIAAGGLPAGHQRFFRELDLYWQDDKYIYVHAGVQRGVHLSMQNRDWLLWSREQGHDSGLGKTVVYGHTAHSKPCITEGAIGIDTGAVYGGRLTCLILPDVEFVSVPGRKYWSP